MDEALLRLANGWLAGIGGPAWAALGAPWAVLALGAALLGWAAWGRRWRSLALAVVAVALTDPLCSRLIKPAVDRARPCHVVADLRLAGDCGSGRSMPSAHAANTAAVAAALASPPLAAVSLAVGTSRVVLGQHYPSDVAAGWALGAALGAGVRWLARRRLGWT